MGIHANQHDSAATTTSSKSDVSFASLFRQLTLNSIHTLTVYCVCVAISLILSVGVEVKKGPRCCEFPEGPTINRRIDLSTAVLDQISEKHPRTSKIAYKNTTRTSWEIFDFSGSSGGKPGEESTQYS